MIWRKNKPVSRPILSLLFILALCVPSKAAETKEDAKDLSRPVIGYYNFEVGSRSVLSTYLSPFSYKGTAFAVSGFWTKVLPSNPEHLAMAFEVRGDMGSLYNRSRTASEIDIHGNLQWGLEWQQRLPHNFIVGVGGRIGIYGGVLYLPRNGNNPVSAQFATGIGVSGSAGWHTAIGKLPILFSDRLTLPLLGGFFNPGYGETYYEIYLGNRKGLAHFGWPGNRFGIDNLLSATLDFGRTAMQIGYRFSMQNSHANNLTTRIFSHAFVIGVIPGGIGLKQKRKDIITPLY